MAYILDTGAVLRLLALRGGDDFLRWIEQAGVRPFIAPVTMAAARDSYQGSPDLTAAQRATYEQRFAALLRDLGQGTEESVIAAELDFNGSRILSEIMAVVAEHGLDVLPFDLIPAAIAIQHNDVLVAADDGGAMQRLAAALPPETGHLTVAPYGPQA